MIKHFINDIEPFLYKRPILYVDVGAHKGDEYSALKTSKLKVVEAHLVEPNPSAYEVLSAGVAARGDRKAYCHAVALGATTGRVTMRESDTMTKVAAELATQIGIVDNVFEAPCTTLDELSKAFSMPKISILKIDVEGFEQEVLRGAERLLRNEQIDVIYVEAGLDPENPQQCYYRLIEDQLREYGYGLFKIYEQKNEWLTDSPLLRRMNLAFMSRSFAANNPYALSREAIELSNEVGVLKDRLLAATEERSKLEELVQVASSERTHLSQQLEATRQANEQSASALKAASVERQRLQHDLSKAIDACESFEARLRSATDTNASMRTVVESLEAKLKEAEIEHARGRDERLAVKKRLEERLRASWQAAAADRRVAKDTVRSSVSYRLGHLIITGARSPLGLLKLPIQVYSLFRRAQAARSLRDKVAVPQRAETNVLRTAVVSPTQRAAPPDARAMEVQPPLPSNGEDKNPYVLLSSIDAQLNQGVILSADLRAQHVITLARCYDYDRCIDAFEAWIDISDTVALLKAAPRALDSYVRSLIRCGQSEKAATLMKQLTTAHPKNTRLRSLAGYVLLSHDPAAASEHLERALDRDSRSVSDLLLLYKAESLLNADFERTTARIKAVDVADKSTSEIAASNICFLKSSLALAADNHSEALSALNSYFTARSLAPLQFTAQARTFSIDHLEPAETSVAAAVQPLLSVLMTTFNSAEFLDTAIRSVLEQSYANFELIVIDDCSIDDTRAKLRQWAARDPRIELIFNKHNVGTYCSKNTGLLLAAGEYVTCHDSDDWSHPQKFERQIRTCIDRDAMACISAWARIDEKGYFDVKRWGRILHTNPSSLMYRRSVNEAIGYYDAVRTGADTEFQNRLSNVFGAEAIITMDLCLALGRSHSASLTRSLEAGFDEHGSSPVRQNYWKSWSQWHRTALQQRGSQLFISFPPTSSRPFEAPVELLADVALVRENAEDAQNLARVDLDVRGGTGSAPTSAALPATAPNIPALSVPAPTSHYWEERKDAVYLAAARQVCNGVPGQAISVLDVGSNNTPTLEWHRSRARRLVSVDLRNPYVAEGIESHKGNFFDFDGTELFDLVTCFQVLEHVPDAGSFAQRLLSSGKTLVVSVPYKWAEGKCKYHIHDPVDEAKMLTWFGIEPISSQVETEKNGVRRMINVYVPSAHTK